MYMLLQALKQRESKAVCAQKCQPRSPAGTPEPCMQRVKKKLEGGECLYGGLEPS